MFGNAACVPSEPVDNLSEATRSIIDPGHVILDGGADIGMRGLVPKRAQNLPRRL